MAKSVVPSSLDSETSRAMASKLEANAAIFQKNEPRLKERAINGSLDSRQYDLSHIPVKYVENSYLRALSEKEIHSAWVQLIEDASDKIEIVSAYLYLYPELIEALSKAAARGIEVKIFTNSTKTTDLSIVNIGAYQEMVKWKQAIAGVKFYELALAPGKGSLHAKIINIDDRFVGIGSANTDPRTFLLDTNNLMIMDLSNNQKLAVDILSQYINTPNYPWTEVTDEYLSAILEGISRDERARVILEATKIPEIIEQL